MVAFNPTGFDPRHPSNVANSQRNQLRQDLEALQGAFDGLVLYAYDKEWTPAIMEAAWQYGFKAILLGVWDPKSEEELTGIAQAIQKYSDKIAFAVVIGNEGLIGNRYTVADLDVAKARLRRMIPEREQIPFTTSEPIGEYGFEPLRSFGEFLAPNIHPALDQEALDPVSAASWARDRAQALATAAGKYVLVKETGLPNGGGPRYTTESQKIFWEVYLSGGFLTRLKSNKNIWVSYAAGFEAYDLPWKAETSGIPSEGHWGFIGTDRRPHPVMDVWLARRSQGLSGKRGAADCQ